MEIHNNVSLDNPLGRLYNIICELKKSYLSSPEKAFCKIFAIDEDDIIGIITQYTELLNLCKIGNEQLQQLNPKKLSTYKETLQRVSKGLAIIKFRWEVSTENLLDFNRHFSVELMKSLEQCADYLSERSVEGVIDQEKIIELVNEVNSLESVVLNSNLNIDLEKLLLYQLQGIKEALIKYKSYGTSGVTSMVSTTLGMLILNQDMVKTVEERNTMKKIFGMITNINQLITMKKNSIELIQGMINKLTNGE